MVTIEAIIVNKGSLAHQFFSSGSGPNEQSVLPVYLGIFLLANLFQFVMTIDAIASRNTIEIIGLDIFQLMLMVYSVVQISEVVTVFDKAGSQDESVPILLDLIPMCVRRTCRLDAHSFMALVFVAYMFLTWPIYKIQGWDVRVRRKLAPYARRPSSSSAPIEGSSAATSPIKSFSRISSVRDSSETGSRTQSTTSSCSPSVYSSCSSCWTRTTSSAISRSPRSRSRSSSS